MTRVSQWSRTADGLSGERGSIAVIAVLGMALLLVITVAFVALAQLETKIGVNHAQEVRAVQAAEAGARRMYRQMADEPTLKTANDWISATPYYPGTAVDTAGTATYTVYVYDNSANPTTAADTDNLVAIKSTGTSGGASQTVTLLVQPNEFSPTDAIRVAGTLSIPGSPKILGACGSVHVDGSTSTTDITVPGDPVVQMGMSTDGNASGDYIPCNAPPAACPASPPASQVSPTTVAGREVPTIDPAKFSRYADYFLNNNGYAYYWDSSASSHTDVATYCTNKTTTCPDPPSGWIKITTKDGGGTYAPGNAVKGWKFHTGSLSTTSPALWESSGPQSVVPGTFYVKGAVNWSDAQGTTSSPLKATIIAEAYISMGGNAVISPDNLTTTSSPVASLNPSIAKDILLIAGEDIVFAGSTGTTPGVMGAHEQVIISGSGTMNGVILANNACAGVENQYPTCDATPGASAANSLSGSFTLNYACGLQPVGLSTPTTVSKWLSKFN